MSKTIIWGLFALTLGGCGPDLEIRAIPNEPPKVEILSHKEGDHAGEGYTITVTAKARDDEPIEESTAKWYLNDVETCVEAPEASDGSTRCDMVVPVGDKMRVRVDVTDASTELATAQVDIEIDPTLPPSAVIVTPEVGEFYFAGTPITFSGAANDAEDASSELTIVWSSTKDGVLSGVNVTPDVQGKISGQATLSEGAHTIVLEVTDLTGKTDSDTVNIAVGPPNDAPTCQMTSPLDDSVSGHWNEIVLAGVVGDPNEAPENLYVEFSSSIDGMLTPVNPTGNGDVQTTWSELSLGAHTLTMRVVDSAGTECTDSVLHTVLEPPTAPVVHIEPERPEASDDLLCIIDTEAEDPQGDPLTYVFEWLRDGVDFAGATTTFHPGDTVESQHIAPGQLWECFARATDGLTTGEAGYDYVTVDPPEAVRVYTGKDNSCLVDNNDWLACWGDSAFNKLGLNDSYITDVGMGANFICGIDLFGFIACSGLGNDGETDTAGLVGPFLDIDSGEEHSCAVDTGGGIQCWGKERDGRVSDAPTEKGFVSVSSAYSHNCAVKADGNVVCWGNDNFGRLVPPAGPVYSEVSAGKFHNCGLDVNGVVHCWGQNEEGEANEPGGTFQSISAGHQVTCGVRGSGEIECWGIDTDGVNEPPPPGYTFREVSTSMDNYPNTHHCAIKDDDGTVGCWGNNSHGERDAPQMWW